jgi:Ran GTPase-activating protein (RanGAP) involved in mRNA processing and transport
VHEKAKRIVRYELSKENFKEHASRAFRTAEAHLRPLLDSKINDCYAAAITEQTNSLIERCKELERLNNENAFFQQWNEEVARIHTSVEKELDPIRFNIFMNRVRRRNEELRRLTELDEDESTSESDEYESTSDSDEDESSSDSDEDEFMIVLSELARSLMELEEDEIAMKL